MEAFSNNAIVEIYCMTNLIQIAVYIHRIYCYGKLFTLSLNRTFSVWYVNNLRLPTAWHRTFRVLDSHALLGENYFSCVIFVWHSMCKQVCIVKCVFFPAKIEDSSKVCSIERKKMILINSKRTWFILSLSFSFPASFIFSQHSIFYSMALLVWHGLHLHFLFAASVIYFCGNQS